MKVDVIVNAANNSLLGGGGVDGAIHRAAGPQLLEECRTLGGCKTGEAKATKGYNLPSKYVIHTVGPIYIDGKSNEEELLISCYKSSLLLAKELNVESIAFPLISSGVYGYPIRQAIEVAIKTIKEFLDENELDVYLVVFDRTSVSLSEKLYNHIEHYIQTYFVEERFTRRLTIESEYTFNTPTVSKKKSKSIYIPSISQNDDDNIFESCESTRSLDDLLNMIDETFSEMMLRLIDEKGYTDSEIYKRANIDRKLFSKMRTQKHYHPSKKTVLALSIALHLSLDETTDFLNKAGYSLSNSQKSDIIIRYFIENKDYNIYTINEALFCFNEPTL
jgi:O-acetyl-ADP-ribose deacetylase (regulator of RNase III)